MSLVPRGELSPATHRQLSGRDPGGTPPALLRLVFRSDGTNGFGLWPLLALADLQFHALAFF